jgi:hypothetical protein
MLPTATVQRPHPYSYTPLSPAGMLPSSNYRYYRGEPGRVVVRRITTTSDEARLMLRVPRFYSRFWIRVSEKTSSSQGVNKKVPLLQYAEVQKVQGRRGTMFFRPLSLKDLSDSIPTGLLRPLLLLTLLSFLGLLFSFLGFVFPPLGFVFPPLGFVFCCLCTFLGFVYAFLGFLCHLLSFFSTAETLRFGHRHIPTREKLQTWGGGCQRRVSEKPTSWQLGE